MAEEENIDALIKQWIDGAGRDTRKAQRSYGTFASQVDEMVINTEAKLTVLARASIQDVINEAQHARAKGGRMRVDTGFLRASGQGSLTGMPTGPVRGDKTAPNSYPYNPGTVTVQLGKLQIGANFYFGWTANYAKYRELYDGFLEAAVRNWPRIVAFHTDAIRERFK